MIGSKLLCNRVNRRELMEAMKVDARPRTTLSFYQYYHLKNPRLFRDHIYTSWSEAGVLGRVYVAREGINAQISVPTENLEEFFRRKDEILFLQGIRMNYAIQDNGKSFFKLSIKVRDKVVADGLEDETFDVTKRGKALQASEFNRLTDDPGTIVVDLRNHYESEVGRFVNAIIPEGDTFREVLPEVEKMLEDKKDANIIFYCTGGIRCEKASAWYLHRGFRNVFMVDGGIIEYTRKAREEGLPNKFVGKNFVFDERLGERISTDVIAHCHQCGKPSDTHVNCANSYCHILFIQCDECAARYAHCCSEKCREFHQLPEEEQKLRYKDEVFNGTRFGKGRYKALHRRESLAQ